MSTLAIGKSISFRPGTLYTEAEHYGLSLTPPLNPSEVVCQFLHEGLVQAGWLKVKRTPRVSAEEARALAELRRLGGDPLAALRTAIEQLDGH